MKKEWSISNDKILLNFSMKYCRTEEQVLNSDAFRGVLEHFLKKNKEQPNRIYRLISETLQKNDLERQIFAITKITKLLTIMTSKEISESFPEFSVLYEHKEKFRHLIEAVYKYWRSIERYCIIQEEKGTEGLQNINFIESKQKFDELILNMYRKITNNLSMTTPSVYRQVPAGTNVGLIVGQSIWPIPREYVILKDIPFIKNIVMETPFITYPKRNTRDGFFTEVFTNPIRRAGINTDHFFCYPAKIGNLLAYIFIHRDFLTQGVSLSNLFQMATEQEIAGRKPDLLYVYGGHDPNREPKDVFYVDEVNQMMVGFVTLNEKYDYFGYLKKMSLTLHNILQLRRGNLPIHGAMVNIVMKNGKSSNIVIVGDSGAGKSESIEAFRSLSEDYISDLTIIFDDMGTFHIGRKENKIVAYGTEIGAFVRLDDLDTGYAFKELDRSIFMNPDKINARLINPVATYKDIMQGLPVDILLYANNYTKVKEDESCIDRFKTVQEAIEVFKAGRRMSKGTTTETGLTTSYFANPFGPQQKQDLCDPLIEKFFTKAFETGIFVGQLKTQLGIQGKEKSGPEKAAIDLFKVINE
ncbi:phosphoenolpyruvate carboxykinase [Alkalibaculum bacchi]|uniref:phosphoenolpyruvate carboxykinase n=1 Tax=Alkalibaculum bacchi TaxID=645887 RepID=UPI0026F007C4|nr:phosphoenolpyruvate carboxykinase [Alkalibaculum bacchi]